MTQVATIVIVAVGMTFVIATGGIDLSVGSLMAIAGVLAPMFLLDANQFGAPAVGLALAIVAPLIATTLLRCVQRHAGDGGRSATDHRHAGALSGRSRHRAAARQWRTARVS